MQIKDLREGDEITYIGDKLSFCVKGKTYKVIMKFGYPRIMCEISDKDPDDPFHTLMNSHMDQFQRFIQQKGGWIGVDLDGTLAVYDKWRGPDHIGEPIMPMVMRVRQWLQEGRNVKIFTARVTNATQNRDGTPQKVEQRIEVIEAWCQKHLGATLPVTNIKDWDMMELWDDRCVQVVPNTGKTIKEHHDVSE